MKRCSLPRLRAVISIAAAMLISLVAVSGYAQLQTGNIYGKVQAKDGSVLPGVTVTLTGVGAPMTFVTDAQGNFRFLNLSPGTYALKAELSGYGVSTRSGLSVSIGRNLDVTMTLAPTVAETITVTAEAPLLDVRKAGTGANVTKIELEKVPTGRDPWVILQQTPGVLMDRINVGGNESGQQSVYVGKGTAGSQQTFNVDGVNITDVGALGSSPTYYDFDAFEEMQVTTGGTDPRIQTPGVQLNMVTKRGTNDFRGSGRYYRTTNDWQADPKIPLEARDPRHAATGSALGPGYLYKSNEINEIDDYGAEAGGPIIRDRLWIWAAYSKQDIQLFTAQPPTVPQLYRDNTILETTNAKVNAQLLSNNSLAAAFTYGDKIKLGRSVGPSRPPETAWNQSGPTNIYKLEDTHIFGPNFYLTGLYSRVIGGFQLIGDQGKGCQDFECGLGVEPAYFDFGGSGTWERSFLNYESDRPQKQYRVDASTFFSTGSWNHELKFGFGRREAPVFSHLAWPGDYYMVFYDAAGTPGAFGGIALHRRMRFDYQVDTQDIYVGDTMMMGNLTIQAGLRLDNQKGKLQPGSVPANAVIPDLLPSLTYNGGDQIEWDSVSPRLGMTYTLGAQKKTLLRAAANRYVDQLGGSAVYLAHPLYYQYLYYYFTDINGDRRVTRNEIDFDYCAPNPLGACAWFGLDPTKTREAVSPYRYDPDISAPRTDELIFGFEHELLTDFSVGMNATWRKRNDLITSRPEKTKGSGNFYSPADYRLGGNLNGTLPNGRAYTVPYYVLNSGVAPPIYYVITNRPDYHQEYKGLEVTATKRMSNRWMFRGNFSWNDWTQDVGPGGVVDPTFQLSNATGCDDCNGPVAERSGGSGDKGRIFMNSKWSYNMTGVYQIPVIETSLGFNLMGRQGYVLPYTHRSPFTSEGFKQVIINTDLDAQRMDNIHNLDLRLAKDIRLFRTAALTISLDAFNVLNRSTILQRNFEIYRAGTNNTYDPGVACGAPTPASQACRSRVGNRITEILSPRVFKLGARFTF